VGGREGCREGLAMTIEGEALLARIYIGESDTYEGRPLYDVIVRLLRERGIRGASVFRGMEGFGRSSRVHTTRILALSEDLPILIEAVDEAARLRPVLDELEPMIGGGLVTIERIEVVVYRAKT
jgi:PII-like signaling protein